MKRLLVEHLPLSVLIGIIGWLAGGSWLCVPFALAVGWCIDADHLFDFAYYWLRGTGRIRTGLLFFPVDIST